MKADFIIRAGEPLSLSLLLVDGDLSAVQSLSAVLKAAGVNQTVPPVSAPVVASFQVNVAPSPNVGWTFYLDSETTQALKPGFYVTNAKINLSSGGPLKTDTIFIEVKGTVT